MDNLGLGGEASLEEKEDLPSSKSKQDRAAISILIAALNNRPPKEAWSSLFKGLFGTRQTEGISEVPDVWEVVGVEIPISQEEVRLKVRNTSKETEEVKEMSLSDWFKKI